MLTTALVNGEKITIQDYKKELGKDALCPLGHRLVAKKGKKVVHHFSHYPGQPDCDAWIKRGMSNWHSQWQKIVLDKSNVEVCLDPNGKIVGISSFHGGNVTHHNPNSALTTYTAPQNNNNNNNNLIVTPLIYSQSMHKMVPVSQDNLSQFITNESHIADIIKPMRSFLYGDHPLVIEIQHSSINKDTIQSRENYYQNMIWLFDATPRISSKEKFNKIAYVDGKMTYLKEKVAYVAVLTSVNNFQGTGFALDNSDAKYLGDECDGEFLSQIGGTFIIINTRTKYWFDTTKPTYFDCGFGILRHLRKLDKGFAITLYLTYEQFIAERMPQVNLETVKESDWFNSIPLVNLLKLNLLPKPIDVSSIQICKGRIIIKYLGNELSGLGLEQGMNEWHGGEFYGQGNSTLNVTTDNRTGKYEGKHKLTDANPTIDMQSDLMMQWIKQAESGIHSSTNTSNNKIANEALLISRLRKFLDVGQSVNIELSNMKGLEIVIIHCNRETYGLKDKFKALGMIYKKNTKRKAKTPTKSNVMTMGDLKTDKESPYYWAKIIDIENKLNAI